MKEIYVLGNPLIEKDSLPIKLIPRLKKEIPEHEFIELDPSEDFPVQKEIVIIDTVINVKEVKLITDIEKIELGSVVSLHDFDLGYNLKLMKKFKLIEQVKIIGVPPNYDEKKAVLEIKEIIQKSI